MTFPHARNYLHHIDGLRAVAVMSVILYHLNTQWLPGGFVGVDIFFVISGYLITRNIVDELAAGRFSIKEFYRRRIKRIAPLALLVVACTLAAGYAVMLPQDAAMLAKSAMWALASMANVYFWKEVDGGYFAPNSEEFPLLHLWSLGVEEQFYFVWPLMLAGTAALLRRGAGLPRRALVWMTVLGCLASAAASIVLTSIYPTFSFYLLPTRAFELMVGALLAILSLDGALAARARPYAGLALGAGALGLLSSICFIDHSFPFPGAIVLVPVLSTALLIGAGGAAPQSPVARALGMKLMARIGVLSYAAYLWHWPLIAFFRYLFGAPGIAACLGLLAATFALALLSHRLLETPARMSTAPFWKLTLRQFVIPGGLTAAACVFLVYGERAGVPAYPAGYLAQLAEQRKDVAPAYSQDWVCQRQRLTPKDLRDPRCVLGGARAAKAEVVVFGDSNAAHYVPMLEVFAQRAGYRFRNLEIGACPPMLDPVSAGVDPVRRTDCVNSLALAWPAVQGHSVVMLGASWTTYQLRSPAMLAQLRATIQSLSAGGSRVVLLAKIPTVRDYDRLCSLKQLRMPLVECDYSPQPMADDVAAINTELAALAASLPGVTMFDPSAYLCSGGHCASRAPDGTPRYYDSSHLSARGAADLGRDILAREGVPAALNVCDRIACSQ